MNMRLRVSGLVFGLGLPGVVAATLYVVPALLSGRPLPMSMPALMAISAGQSALLVLVAASWAASSATGSRWARL